MSQAVIIGVAASSSGSATPLKCSFHLGDKVLPSNSYVETWRNGKGGLVSDSLGQVLLLPANLEHYSDYKDDDLVLKLKWHTIVVSLLFV